MNTKIITSAHNQIIKDIKELQTKKATRKKQGLFVVEGLRAVKDIPSIAKVKYILATPQISKSQFSHLAPSMWVEVSEDIYKLVSETQTPQGVMAVVQMPQHPLEELCIEDGNYLLLENLQDPGNMGTIIRTAYAFGFKGVFITKGSVDVYSPKVVRSTMSALFYLPIIIDYCLEECIAFLKEQGVCLYTTALSEQAKPLYDIQFTKRKAIVIGNEGNGVSKEMLDKTDYTIMIPMPGGAESLNASVAAGICMYEVSKPS